MSKGGRRERRQGHKQSLGDQIEDPRLSHGVRTHPRGSGSKRQRGGDDADGDGDGANANAAAAASPADARRDALAAQRTSARILREARLQQEEVDLEDAAREVGGNEYGGEAGVDHRALAAAVAKATTRRGGVGAAAADSSDEEDDDEGGDGEGGRPGLGTDVYDDDDERLVAQGGGGYDYGGADLADEVSPEDEAALRAFMGGGGGAGGGAGGANATTTTTTTEGLWGAPAEAGKPSRDLAGLVLERMREKQVEQQEEAEAGEAAAAGAASGRGGQKKAAPEPPLDERVAEVYRGVGQLLKRYTSGPLPKALKVVPSLRSWEQALALTSPDEWSPHAHYACCRLFVSNLSDRTAPRYLRSVLLPAVREDIRAHQRLHFALFQALRKSTYKPGAFFKGVLLPLCADGDCTLREAVIFSSVLKRASLPALHSAAALLRLSKLPYCGTTSFFLRVLLDKRYALPYAVVDALCDHFCAFSDDERTMPVVWHQSLLCFAQRYGDELSAEEVGRLRALCATQHHYAVTPEVLRELDAADGAVAAGKRRRGGGGGGESAVGAAKAAAGAGGAAAGSASTPGAKLVALVGTGATREDPRDLPPVFMGDDE